MIIGTTAFRMIFGVGHYKQTSWHTDPSKSSYRWPTYSLYLVLTLWCQTLWCQTWHVGYLGCDWVSLELLYDLWLLQFCFFPHSWAHSWEPQDWMGGDFWTRNYEKYEMQLHCATIPTADVTCLGQTTHWQLDRVRIPKVFPPSTLLL